LIRKPYIDHQIIRQIVHMQTETTSRMVESFGKTVHQSSIVWLAQTCLITQLIKQ